MDGLPLEPTQSLFALKVALAFSPIFIFGTADLIGWFLRHTPWRHTGATFRAEAELARDEAARLLRHWAKALGRVADRLGAR
jgi:hypothetical protein